MTLFDEIKEEEIKIRNYLRHLSIGAVVTIALILIILVIALWYYFGYTWVIVEPGETSLRAINSTIG
ncbi:MAG: hypothetical protein DRO90_01090 [Candidatus Altiarchaeales archaeon]|nr:MAG: hypothetical protein DRO95_05800 [Candidatus Altiarchaeales archaeon]RLI93941.1 MAG: hypothetical protein DRO94_04045 [Candidatus Altiarchaeales archaeon]RLI95001.1 MAG: hypothetical protein DRO90_01090 [Candidatus Altiarchaeales archaeon]HDO82668.1 hypothetical protein [Candidatus Altiarchaeales archaeon]HEX55317.1 hypothetical protein [Candidatus Altiarchaeales archaeon]